VNAVGWLAEKLTDLFRPWHDDGLPEDLGFGVIDKSPYVRGSMSRFAWLSAQEKMPFGVFEIVGLEYAPRAARAWWPRERLLMEDFMVKAIAEEAGIRTPSFRVSRVRASVVLLQVFDLIMFVFFRTG
jgi:hypothetical protein